MKEGFLDIYADVYMVLGLQEYFKATGDEEAKRLALETAYAANNSRRWPPTTSAPGTARFMSQASNVSAPGSTCSSLDAVPLPHARDGGAGPHSPAFCARNILTKHWQRDKGFAWECLDHQYQPYSQDYLSQWVKDYDWATRFLGWHTIQAPTKSCWKPCGWATARCSVTASRWASRRCARIGTARPRRSAGV